MSTSSPTSPATADRPKGIDPRGPRFAAGITSVLVLIATFLSAIGISTAFVNGSWAISDASLAQRASDPGFILFVIIALLFLWAVLSPATQPYGWLYRTFVRPRLKPPAELEDPRPPRFAQGVGLFVVTIGLVLHLLGVPLALPIAGAAAFIAAFLNASIGLCLGCQLYLVLARAGFIGRSARPA
ncbi:DUF4395 domain-containing protein [Microbacterium rhizomatis]|uniref:DUF4395 domain-containing protein n=1 Tax=Microbacterium rhizomatis TaxID=1631477 RepID=A0A5J5J5M0_9MICO|nr:DUF4395 domain-containing protein [Microbacterium rhizomatis]KAA9111436.1 DUF4395 domain-containing protein [Microbacterium rhizomatis]